MHTGISAFAKKSGGAADRTAKQRSSYEETVVPARSARMADADCSSRHFLRQPSWQQTTGSLALGQISECQFPLLIWQLLKMEPLKMAQFFEWPDLR